MTPDSAELTPFQTVGPFFEVALPAPGRHRIDRGTAPTVRIEGTVRDGAGHPVDDALIETWQADQEGRYDRTDWDGYGWMPTDGDGCFALDTVLPGQVPLPDREGTLQAPHLLVGVLARGILTRLVTRIYFEGQPSNATDPVLLLVPEARRSTLIARRLGETQFRFDIVLQGVNETVFFDV